ncbi:hypothetical protein [uncultured Algibacter sp.]|uniref:hypothetical protein n=1 Tax=uncultured Algibacter sp. TaxID=298659 RepID=UPI0026382939|nr:hypothetical protein [uncultured Algibacter sp.]
MTRLSVFIGKKDSLLSNHFIAFIIFAITFASYATKDKPKIIDKNGDVFDDDYKMYAFDRLLKGIIENNK